MNSWQPEEIKIAYKLYNDNKLYREISEALTRKGYDRSSEAVRKLFIRHREDPYAVPTPEPRKGPDESYRAIKELESMRGKILGKTTKGFVQLGRPVRADTKILCISDPHFPFHNEDVINHALENHSDADILVLNGDILDQYSVSKFSKYRPILLQYEYEIALEYIKMFSNMFPKVKLVSGNHDDRVRKQFARSIDPAVQFLTSPDVVKRLSQGYGFTEDGEFEQLYSFGNVYYDGQEGVLNNWYTKIGKCLFIHPSDYLSTPMRTVVRAFECFIGEEDFDCIVCAHTHAFGSLVYKGKLLMEQGCICLPVDYHAREGRLIKAPNVYGYAVVYMDKQGNVDFQKTHNVFFGTGRPVKTGNPLDLIR